MTSVLNKDEPDILFLRSLSLFSLSSHRNWQNLVDDDRMGRTLVNVINKNL